MESGMPCTELTRTVPQEDGLRAIPTSNMVASVKNEEDGEDSLSSRTVSQEWQLCAISTMGMVTSGEDEEGFDVLDTISGRYELDSALVQTSKPRPILQLLSQERRLCAISTMSMVTSGEDEEGVLLEQPNEKLLPSHFHELYRHRVLASLWAGAYLFIRYFREPLSIRSKSAAYGGFHA
ncbi:MAG: hypothetical protein NXY57DRAFT_1044532 [Lentinula lateritia]|nr:MAG: hypothetical protein NXY57DRAFT_1044532 [Lentinula lateritia]